MPDFDPTGGDELTRNAVINGVRGALRARTGRAWSVTGGVGTAYGWITVSSLPRHRNRSGAITTADRQTLAAALGLPDVPPGGLMIPPPRTYRADILARAEGRHPSQQPATPTAPTASTEGAP